MRDLVETVISQVLKQEPQYTSRRASSVSQAPTREIKSLSTPMDYSKPEIKDERLWDKCCKFEAIFLQQMMTAMRKSVPKSDFLPSGFAEGVYDQMFDQAVAESGSKQASLGIATNLYRQLERDGDGASADIVQGISQAADNISMDVYQQMKGVDNGSN